MINTSWPVHAAHSALSIAPVAGFNRDRAPTSASSDSSSTVCRQPRASTDPASGAVNDQPPAPSSSMRSRSIGCRSSKACSTTTTSASVTPAGACTTMVWLNCSTGPSTLLQPAHDRGGHHRPDALVDHASRHRRPRRRPGPAGPRSARRKYRAADTVTPAARARATTCIDKMLSPPRSKNESSTPTRSSPSTWA